MNRNLLPRMCWKIHNYQAWEERIISEVNVQYYLRSCSGKKPLLAAVGNENSEGHMIYVVAKEYLEAFGSNATINAYTQWTKRRDVVKWLISLVTNDDSPATKSDPHLVPKHKGNGLSIDKEEKLPKEDLIKSVPKKLRSSLVHRKQESVRSDAQNLVAPKEAAASEPVGMQALELKPHQPLFQVGEKIEILCQDSGMRGCWFMCKIVKVSKNNIKIQYNDADDVEGSGKLEEWVCASRLADPDKLSLRHSGRPIIRPFPPEEPSSDFFEVGTAVEAWWKNGWWESFVLTGATLKSNNDSYNVFLPGENKFLTVDIKDMRVAKEWIDNTWVAVKPQPDVLSVIWSSFKRREE